MSKSTWDDARGGEIGAAVVLILVLLAPSLIWGGWVIATVWNWWLPATIGAPAITVRAGVGIALVRGVVWGSRRTEDDPAGPAAEVLKAVFVSVFTGLYWLAVAGVGHLLAF